MSARNCRHSVASRPGDADSQIKPAEAPARRADDAGAFTARLTIYVTPVLRSCATVAAFRSGITVADMRSALLGPAFPCHWRVIMNDKQSSPTCTVPSSRRHSQPLTDVHLTWIEKKIEFWLRFGRPAEERILDRRRSISSFAPGSTFGFVRWVADDYGTVISRMDIVRTVAPGEPYQRLPFLRPGGELLLRADGWPKVERVHQAIDAIEGLGINPADVAPDHWRHLHNRFAAGHAPRTYTCERHDAWLKRRSVTS